jgi:hypothetical protein
MVNDFTQSVLKFGAGVQRRSSEQVTQMRAVRDNDSDYARSPMSKIGKWKVCDFGYAPAAGACERANNADALRRRSPWCDHRFRSSKPRLLLAEFAAFSGLLPFRSPCRADHSAYFGLARFISPALSAVDAEQAK